MDFKEETPTLTFGLPTENEAKAVPETAAQTAEATDKEAELTPEEMQKVDAFAEQINLTDSQAIMNYGVGTQKKMADFSEKAIDNVRTKDMGEVGDMLTSLVTQLKDFDVEEDNKGIMSIFRKGNNRVNALKAKYSKVETNVSTISGELEKHQIQLMKDE